MLAYHNDPVIKADILSQLQAHHDADEIVRGHYWENGTGCAVGCTVHGKNHVEYERLFGIPRGLARLEDTIFEHLPNGDAQQWPLRFMRAIVPGADLSKVWREFHEWVPRNIALSNAGPDRAVRAAIRGTIAVFGGRIATGQGNDNARRTAHGAARYAAWRAAFGAAHSAAYRAMADKLIELLATAPAPTK